MTDDTTILIVDDRPENLVALDRILAKPGRRIIRASSGSEALALTLEHDLALILLDVQMPGMDGFETAELMRGNARTSSIPIIFVTAINKEEGHVFRGYEAGAVDYIFKPFNPDILRGKVEVFCDLHRERLRAERANSLLASTLASINEAVIAAAPDGRITFCNRTAEQLTGWKDSEAVGRPLREVLALRDSPGDATGLPRSGEEQTAGQPLGQAILVSREGQELLIAYRERPIQTPKGETFGMVISFADITERTRIERQLTQVLREQRIILDNMAAGILYLQDDVLRWANAQAGTILGKLADTLHGRSLACLLGAMTDSADAIESDLARGLATVSGYRGDLPLRRLDGSLFWCRLIARAIDSTNPRLGIILLLEDITSAKQAEADREKMRAQLLQAQKMEAVGTLAAGIAHDFNNVLTAIQGYLELGMMKVGQDEPAHLDLEKARDNSRRAAELVRQLLLFSRKQPMQFVTVNVSRSLQGLMKMLHRIIGEDIRLEILLPDDLWPVQGDAGNLEQVLMNLAVNARDAMPTGGALTFHAGNVVLGERDIAQDWADASPGRFVRVTVHDTGSGIPEEVLPHIFEPFFTTKGVGKGTGLGLSVVYGIVKEHGGWIDVRSALGRGTIFSVYLPASNIQAQDPQENSTELGRFRGRGEKILLVEDEPQVSKLAMTALSLQGYVVVCAGDCQEARECFERDKASFHLVFSDIVLPDGIGLDLTDSFRRERPNLKVILSSGYTGDKSRWVIIKERNIPFLQKPYSIGDLLRAVHDVLQGGA